MGLFSDSKPAPKRDPQEAAREQLRRAQSGAGMAVIDAAREAVRKLSPSKQGVAMALVKQAEVSLRSGDISGSAGALTRALGDTWGRKLRTATAARVSRPTRRTITRSTTNTNTNT